MSYKKIISYKRLLQCLGFVCSFLSHAHSLYLEKINIAALGNKRVAYYPGSFDPLQLGHMTAVKAVLDKNLTDFVLIYALPDSDSAKKRVAHLTRFLMLESVYATHPRVLITKLMPAEMQDILAPLFNNIEFSVIVGSDIINTYVKTTQYDEIWMQGLPFNKTKPEHAQTSTGAIMAIPAKHVIAFLRDGDDLSHLKGIYKNRPITILAPNKYGDLSSTQARVIVKQGGSLAGIVPSKVAEIIKRQPTIKDPSKNIPSFKRLVVIAETGIDMWCQVPLKSVKRKST